MLSVHFVSVQIMYNCSMVCMILFLFRGVIGHFVGQRPWAPIEDVVNKQSGVLVGKTTTL